MIRYLGLIGETFGATVLPMLVDAATKGGVVLLVIGLITIFAKQKSAALRHLLWVTGLLVLFSLPALSWVMPQWRVLPTWFWLQPITQNTPSQVSGAVLVATPSLSVETETPRDVIIAPTSDSSLPLSNVHTPWKNPNDHEAVLPVTASLDEETKASSRTNAWTKTQWLSVAWLVGGSLFFLRLMGSVGMLALRESRATFVSSGPLFDELSRVMREWNFSRPVQLLMGGELAMPMAWGVLRRRILLPSSAKSWTVEQLRSVLLHELGHIRRRDPLWQWIVELSRAVYWFHPLVWFAAWRVSVERERACDDLVLQAGVTARDYARSLLAVLASASHRQRFAGAVPMAATDQLEDRVRKIMNSRCDRRALRRRSIAMICSLAFVMAVSLAMLQAGNQAAEPEPQSDEKPKVAATSKEKNKDTCELSGHVLDKGGRVISGAELHLWQQRGVEKNDLLASREVRPRTDDTGRFDIGDLPPGNFLVSATYTVNPGEKEYKVWSEQKPVTLVAGERSYRRFRLVVYVNGTAVSVQPPEYKETVPAVIETYLSSGGPANTGTWNSFNFDPRSIQAAGHRPPQRTGPQAWGERRNGLEAMLVLDRAEGSPPERRRATLVIRNVLPDRMLSLKRQQDREKFAFEVLHPNGRVEVIEQDIWPFNSLRPSHTWNGLFLRPGDEYEIPLGEFKHEALTKPQDGLVVRGRLTLFSDNESADAVRQEEFFPTSLIESAWVAMGERPAMGIAKTQGAEQPLIRLLVVDEKTGEPVPAMQGIPGVESMGIHGDDEYTPLVQWQPHLWMAGVPGKLDWPLTTRSYDTMRLRIEADGYRPVITQLLRKADGPVTLLMKMKRSAGAHGVVMLSDGSRAVKAQVAVAMSARTVQIEKRRIVVPEKLPDHPADRWRLPLVVETDSQGQFTLPDEVVPALVVVAHEKGYAEIRRDEVGDSPKIVLTPWCRAEGKVLWGDIPGANEGISLSASRPSRDWIPLVNFSAKTKTDAAGYFAFENVPPGLAQISHFTPPEKKEDGTEGNTYFSGPILHAQLLPNEPNHIVIGGKGQPLIGQLKGQIDWTGVKMRLFPRAPRPGDGEIWAAYSKFASSPAGKLYHREIEINADGSFRVENVLAESYQWTVFGPKRELVVSGSKIVEPTATGSSEQPIDLGIISVKGS